jgi:hypothetical protein
MSLGLAFVSVLIMVFPPFLFSQGRTPGCLKHSGAVQPQPRVDKSILVHPRESIIHSIAELLPDFAPQWNPSEGRAKNEAQILRYGQAPLERGNKRHFT